MSEYNLLVYYYGKWKKSDTNEEKLNVLVDYIVTTANNEEYAEYFGLDLESVDYFDKFDIEDYMENNVIELEYLWRNLIRKYEQNEEE